MSAVAKIEDKAKTGLDLLRQPFSANQISKLPKPTKAQTDAVKASFKAGIRCKLCGAWHHPDVVHLDYVGHAAITDRLLDADPQWSWEPFATRDGLPAFDQTGGLWIKLTVCGVTRLGYGHAASKPAQDPGAREKEVIGDALRNAAMRFGAALDLWHKGDLHGDGDDEAEGDDSNADDKGSARSNDRGEAARPADPAKQNADVAKSKADSRDTYSRLSKANRELESLEAFDKFWATASVQDAAKSLPVDWKTSLKAEKEAKYQDLLATAAGPVNDDVFPGDLPMEAAE